MSLRDQFPIFRHHPNLVYLDSAATAHKPDCVIAALSKFYAEDYATVHRAAYRSSMRATTLYEEAREAVCRFLNAVSSEEIVFTKGTTESINLVARSFPFEEGDEIWVSALEHHSNLVPWQMVACQKGLKLRQIPLLPCGSLDLTKPFSARTKLVAVTHMSNVTGEIPNIAQIVKEAKKVGAKVFVDGAQAAPHLIIDVQDLGVDFYAFSAHKCYGPTGIGVLYGKKELLAQMDPWQGGGSMVQTVSFEESTYQEPPLRFEAGTPMIGAAIALKAAIEFLQSIDRQSASDAERNLSARIEKELRSIPKIRILGTPAEKGPILTFTIDGIHSLDLAALLDCRDIAIRTGHLCAQPLLSFFGCSTVSRVSLGLYNTNADADRFLEALRHCLSKF